MRRPSVLLPVLVALILPPPEAAAQMVGERAGTMLPFLSTDARGAALGDATSALTGDLAGLETNPATTAFLGRSRARITSHQIESGFSLQSAAIAFPIGSAGGLGLDATVVHAEGLSFYTNPEIRSDGFELTGGISGSLTVIEDLAAGAALRVFHSTTDVEPVWAYAANLGLVYTPGRYYRFGLTLRGFGSDYHTENPILPVDDPTSRLPRVFGLAAAFLFPLGTGGRHILFDFENEKIFSSPGILYKLGVELRPWEPLALRGGMQIRGDDVEPRAGGGITLSVITLDYAYRYNHRDGVGHLATLSAAWK